MIGVANEDFSIEALTELWMEYFKEHDHISEILEAAAQYPEVQRHVFDFEDLSKFNLGMAEHLMERPTASLMVGENALQSVQPHATRVPLRLCPRNLPVVKRPLELRARDMGLLVAVKALVTLCHKATLHYTMAVFQCMRCGAIHRVDQDTPGKLKEPIECYDENGGCKRPAGSTKFRCLTNFSDLPDPFMSSFIDREMDFSETTFERWLTVQDVPESLGDREVPTTYKVRLEGDDVIDVVLQGERVMLYGILRTNNEKRVVSPEIYLDVIHLENLSRQAVVVSEEDEARLRALVTTSADPFEKLLVPSLAPHVVGLHDPKSGIVCMLLGGLSGDTGDKVMRGEQHIMMVGKPATGKSLLLTFVPRLMERANYVNADLATRAGLVAKAEREGDGWVARPGKVALADTAFTSVDEMDKLPKEELDMLLEAMSQGKVTVTKAGSAEFKARTAILAAANPKEGYYSDLREAVDISPALASRFALVYEVEGTPESRKALQRSMRPYYGLGEKDNKTILTVEDFAKYIVMARRLRPKVTEAAADMIERHHDSLMSGETTWTDRVLEDLYRLSVAVARSRLSEEVTEEDALKAIAVHSAGAWGDSHVSKVQVDHVVPRSQEERIRAVLALVSELEGVDGVPYSLLQKEAITRWKMVDLDLRQSLDRLHDDGKVIEKRSGVWGTG